MAEPALRHDFRSGLRDGSVVLLDAAGDPFHIQGCRTVSILAVIQEREYLTGRKARVSCPRPASIRAAAVSDGPVRLPAVRPMLNSPGCPLEGPFRPGADRGRCPWESGP